MPPYQSQRYDQVFFASLELSQTLDHLLHGSLPISLFQCSSFNATTTADGGRLQHLSCMAQISSCKEFNSLELILRVVLDHVVNRPKVIHLDP